MAKNVSLKTIADKVGVSTSTVSQALKNSGRISEETTEMIKKVADELGYSYKKQQTTGNIALFVNYDQEFPLLSHFFYGFVNSLENGLVAEGFNLIIVPLINRDVEEIHSIIEDTNSIAAIFFQAKQNVGFDFYKRFKIPILFAFDNKYQDKFLSVGSDDYDGAYQATNYLLEMGHKRIAFVKRQEPRVVTTAQDRYFGLVKALHERSLEISKDEVLTLPGFFYQTDVDQHIKDLLVNQKEITAIYCVHDSLARLIYKALENLGVSVPDDISIIASGDVLEYTDFSQNPKITTMRTQTEQIGKLSANLLIKELNASEAFQQMGIKVKQKLMERGSCKPPQTASD